jgi:hypothetical protein
VNKFEYSNLKKLVRKLNFSQLNVQHLRLKGDEILGNEGRIGGERERETERERELKGSRYYGLGFGRSENRTI